MGSENKPRSKKSGRKARPLAEQAAKNNGISGRKKNVGLQTGGHYEDAMRYLITVNGTPYSLGQRETGLNTMFDVMDES